MNSYTPVLECLLHEATGLGDPNAPDWITSYTQPRLARICDQLTQEILLGKIVLPARSMPFFAIRLDVDAYEDTIVGWALRVAHHTSNSKAWEMINEYLCDDQHKRIEGLLTDALRGCLTPKHACYDLTYRAKTYGLTSHDIIELSTRLNMPD